MTQTSGRSRSSVAQTRDEVRLGKDLDSGAAPEPVRAKPDLGRRLLAGDQDDLAARDMSRSAISRSVDLPIPGSPLTRTSEAGTRPPPRTRSSSGTPVGRRSASEASTSTSRRSGRAGAAACPSLRGNALLDEGAPALALRTAAEPPPGRVTAFGACVLDELPSPPVQSRSRSRRRLLSSESDVRQLRHDQRVPAAGAEQRAIEANLSSCSKARPGRRQRT